MSRKLQTGLLASLLALLCRARAGRCNGISGPFILHPVRHEISAKEVTSADKAFSEVCATRTDLVTTASDGVVLRGWKVRAAHPNGKWVLLLHGRSQNRLSMMGYARMLLTSGYSVVMMDARAHGESGGTISTYGHMERYDVKAVMDALTASESIDSCLCAR